MDTLSKDEDITGLIVDYLKSHPDFFREHPRLLRDLNIPHDAGRGVSSLIERQVLLLRNQIKTLEQHGDARDVKIRQERFLSAGTYSLTAELLSRKSVDGLYHSLHRFLAKYSIADTFRLFIFSDHPLAHGVPEITFLHRQANLRLLFIELLNRRKPLCSSLQEEHTRLLFGKQGEETRSSLVIPLVQSKWDGLFVLGSQSPGRYAYGSELDTLIFITNIVCYVLSNWIGEPDVCAGSEVEEAFYYPTG